MLDSKKRTCSAAVAFCPACNGAAIAPTPIAIQNPEKVIPRMIRASNEVVDFITGHHYHNNCGLPTNCAGASTMKVVRSVLFALAIAPVLSSVIGATPAGAGEVAVVSDVRHEPAAPKPNMTVLVTVR